MVISNFINSFFELLFLPLQSIFFIFFLTTLISKYQYKYRIQVLLDCLNVLVLILECALNVIA